METNFERENSSTDNKCFNNNIDKKEKQILSENKCLLTTEELMDDESWEIEENSDSDDDIYVGVSPSCKILMLDAKKNIFVPYKKLENSSCAVSKHLSDKEKIKELKAKDESNLPVTKENKPLRFTELLEMHKTPDLIKKDLESNNKIPKKKIEYNEGIGMNLNQIINNGKHSPNWPNSTCFDGNHYLPPSNQLEPKPNSISRCSDYEPSIKNLPVASWSENSGSPFSKDINGLSSSKDLYGPSSSKDLYGPSSSKDLYGPSSSKDLNAPSCSKDFYNLSSSKDVSDPCSSANSSAKFNSLHSVSNPPVPVDNNSRLTQEEEVELLLGFYNKIHSNELFVPSTKPEEENVTNQDVKILATEECDFTKDVLKNVNKINENSNNSPGSSECFVEDPDIVNLDIMYNINLNEHLKQMNALIEKISKSPNDPSLLDECMQLSRIPEVESSKKSFTAEERQNFAEGNPEWEYEIDKDDWNKIMVKRAVVFTAHAGFSIANEESLYVLADVAISYIKQLAVIMKKYFDIQSKSSCPDRIDPMNNSLQEIGITGGINELIKHYENDVFGKRNKLIKKCHHLQKIIDQFVERLFLDPKIKNKYTKDNLGEENSLIKVMNKDEPVFSKEKMNETEEPLKTEIQSTVEEIKFDSLSSAEKTAITNAKFGHLLEPINIEYIDDSKMDNDSNNDEKMQPEIVNSLIATHQQYYKNRSVHKYANKLDIDLLKPLDFTLNELSCETSNVKEKFSSSIDLETQKPNVFCVKKPFNCDQNILGSLNQLSAKPPVSRTPLCKTDKPLQNYIENVKTVIEEYDDKYEVNKVNLSNENTSTSNIRYPQFHKNPADNKPIDISKITHAFYNQKQTSSTDKRRATVQSPLKKKKKKIDYQ